MLGALALYLIEDETTGVVESDEFSVVFGDGSLIRIELKWKDNHESVGAVELMAAIEGDPQAQRSRRSLRRSSTSLHHRVCASLERTRMRLYRNDSNQMEFPEVGSRNLRVW